MDRLTRHDWGEEQLLYACDNCIRGLGADYPPCATCNHENDALEKLRAYENTDLTPEEILQLKGIITDLLKRSDDICFHCKNRKKCDKDCDHYEEGIGAKGSNGETYPDFKWCCMDFDFGDCTKLENTPCGGCFDNNYSGFDWCGIQEEE